MGRKRLESPRGERLFIRVTKAEKQTLLAVAKSLGYKNISEMVRSLLKKFLADKNNS